MPAPKKAKAKAAPKAVTPPRRPRAIRTSDLVDPLISGTGQVPEQASVTLRLDSDADPATALKALKVKDEMARKLAEELTARRDEIVAALGKDPELAELLVNDPPAALEKLGIPAELLVNDDRRLREELQRRYQQVKVAFGDLEHIPVKDPDRPSAATLSALQVLAATMQQVEADPTLETQFTTGPRALVAQAAAATLAGMQPAAAGAVVNDVVAALDAVAHRVTFVTPEQLALPDGVLHTIPLRPRS